MHGLTVKTKLSPKERRERICKAALLAQSLQEHHVKDANDEFFEVYIRAKLADAQVLYDVCNSIMTCSADDEALNRSHHKYEIKKRVRVRSKKAGA